MKKYRCKLFRSNIGLVFILIVVATGLGACAGKNQDFRAELSSRTQLNTFDDDFAREETPRPVLTSEDYERRGDGYLERGNFSMAFLEYDKSLKLSPENVKVLYKSGLTFLLAGKSRDALDKFESVIKMDSNYALAYEGMGRAFCQMKEYEKAEKNFKKAGELNPELWQTSVFLGMVYDKQKRYPLAIREYNRAIRLRPNEGFLYNNLGISHMLAGKYKNAVSDFYNALQRNYSDSKVYNNLGLALARAGEYEEALEAFRKGGNEAQAHNNLGCIYMERDEYGKAVTCFEKAIEINPTFYIKAKDNLEKAKIALARK